MSYLCCLCAVACSGARADRIKHSLYVVSQFHGSGPNSAIADMMQGFDCDGEKCEEWCQFLYRCSL